MREREMLLDILTDVPQSLYQEFAKVWEWLTDRDPAIQTLAALITILAVLFNPWKGLFGRIRGSHQNAPRVGFSLQQVDPLIGDASRIVLRVTNIGGSV